MVKEVAPLIWHCFRKIAKLLKRSYWNLDSQTFKTFPSALIDQLIAHVTDISKTEPLKCSDLQLLIASGRVSEFILHCFRDDVKASPQTISDILRHLSSACKYLTKVSMYVNLSEPQEYSIVIPHLNNLLRKARSIEYVESNLEFDLRQLRNSPKLNILVINFEPKNQLYRLLSVNGQLKINNSLLYLLISDNKYPLADTQIAIILKYCSRLIYFNVNIADALELLHAEEWKNGNLAHKYNIGICILGCFSKDASEIAVRIASQTCPRIEKIILHVGRDDVISALNSLRNMKSLHLYWNQDSYGDYTKEVQPLLEQKEFGQKLRDLELQYFHNTDISSISACCPNLEKLWLKACSSKSNCSDILPIRFPKLTYLIFVECQIGIIGREQLIQLLSSAHDLKIIQLDYEISFTDHMLENVLMQNSLSRLTTFVMRRCELSLNCVRLLATTARSLDYFSISDCDRENEIRAVFAELNPDVMVNIQDETNSE